MADLESPSHDNYGINFLDGAQCRFEREIDGARLRLTISDERCWLEVRVARSLPLTSPDTYIAVRDAANAEIGIFETLESLDSSSCALVVTDLDKGYLLPLVQVVTSVKEQSGLVLWDIVTDHGPRKFAVRNIRDNSVALTSKRVLVTDVEGNRYDFRDIYTLGKPAGDVLQKVL